MQVSIITPYYNGRVYLPDYIKMIMRNAKRISRDDTVEVILINDCPTDNLTPEYLLNISHNVLSEKCTYNKKNDSLIISYGDIKVSFIIITNKENVGIHQSRINGLKNSGGDFVIFLDQDDLLSKDAVFTYLENVNKTDDVLVGNAMSERQGYYLKWFRTGYQKDKVGDIDTYIDVGTQIISPGHTFIRKSSIPEEWTKYICTNNGADDYFLWLLMLSQNRRFRYIDKTTYLHRYTGNNLSEDTTVTDTSSYEFCDYLDRIEHFPEKYANRLRRMVGYKASFRAGSYYDKLTISTRNLDILTANIIFKLRSRTPLGFNR